MIRVGTYAAIALCSYGIFWWLAEVLKFGLRDPRFFDGWVLVAGMAVQMLFHIRGRVSVLRRLRETTWTRIHLATGYVVIGAFAVHTRTAFPNSYFEWALWGLFALVVVSGIVGSYLKVAIPVRLEQLAAPPEAAPMEFDAIAARRLQLARKAEALATSAGDAQSLRTFWELYSKTLRDFFASPRNVIAHLKGSKLPLRQLNHELETSALTLDERDLSKLQSLKTLVVEKDGLDFRYAHYALLKTWSFVHVPVTYGLIVLSIFHIAVVYAFSSGVP